MAKKEDVFGGKEPLKWVRERLGDDPEEGQQAGGGSPEEPMLPSPSEEPVTIRLADVDTLLNELKTAVPETEVAAEPPTPSPEATEAATIDDLKKLLEEAMAPSREQINVLSTQVNNIATVLKVLDDKSNNNQYRLDGIITEQMNAVGVQRDFLSSHHAETVGAIDKIAKSLLDAHQEFARQGNKAMDITNGLANALTEEIQRTRKSFIKTIWVAAATVTAVVVLACGLIVWPALNDMNALLRSESIGAPSTVQERIKQLRPPAPEAEREEEATGQQLGEEKKPAAPEKKAEPGAPSQPTPPAQPPAGGIKKRFQ